MNSNDVNIYKIIDGIIENKWLISGISVSCLAIGIGYAILSPSIYQSNSLIQVEQNNRNTTALGEIGSLFDIQSAATAEIEILKSRSIIEKAVTQLQLDITIEPHYLPIVGQWIAKRSESLSNPGILGFGNYINGNEEIHLSELSIKNIQKEEKFYLIKTDEGYDLYDENDKKILEAKQKIKYDIILEKNKQLIIKIDDIKSKKEGRFNIKIVPKLQSVDELQKKIGISEKGKQSGIINITLEGENKEKINKIIDKIGESYVQQNTERKAAEAEKTLKFLNEFLPELKNQLTESEESYTAFRNKNKTFDLSEEGKIALEVTSQLKIKKLELEQKKKELAARYTQIHPAIITVNEQISKIDNELKNIEAKSAELPTLEQDLLNLTRNVKVNSELYVSLLNNAQQLQLIKEGKVGNVRVIDKAASTIKPIKPQKSIIVILSLLIGLGLGGIAAYIKSIFQNGIKDASEIENKTGVSVFSIVPKSPNQEKIIKEAQNKKKGIHVLAYTHPQDQAVESLRSLRTAIQFALMEAKNKVILITGPTPGIGKSFISVNTAAVLAASGKKVLLIDADLRKGYLNQYFGIKRENGFSETIANQLFDKANIHKNVLPNLDLLTTGSLPPNPSELLLSSVVASYISSIESEYDLILIDSAPVLAVSDSLALASIVGTTLLVVRAETTSLGELNETIRRLNHNGIFPKGIMFNGVIPRSRRYGQQYGYYQYTNYEYTTKT